MQSIWLQKWFSPNNGSSSTPFALYDAIQTFKQEAKKKKKKLGVPQRLIIQL